MIFKIFKDYNPMSVDPLFASSDIGRALYVNGVIKTTKLENGDGRAEVFAMTPDSFYALSHFLKERLSKEDYAIFKDFAEHGVPLPI